MSTPTLSVVKRSDVSTYSAPQKNKDARVAKFAPQGARDVYLAWDGIPDVCSGIVTDPSDVSKNRHRVGACALELISAFRKAKTNEDRVSIISPLAKSVMEAYWYVKAPKKEKPLTREVHRILPKVAKLLNCKLKSVVGYSAAYYAADLLKESIWMYKYKKSMGYLVKAMVDPKALHALDTIFNKVSGNSKAAVPYLRREHSKLVKMLYKKKTAEAAAASLAWIGDKKSIAALIGALNHTSSDIHIEADYQLTEMGKPVLPHLRKALKMLKHGSYKASFYSSRRSTATIRKYMALHLRTTLKEAKKRHMKRIREVILQIDPKALKPQKAPVINRPKP